MSSLTDSAVNFTLDSEELFKIQLIEMLGDAKYTMIKSQHKYCCVDFMLLNQSNLLSVLIEHKRKHIDAGKYDTFFIGYSKLITLETYYNRPLFLVFECNDSLYWCEYSEEFVNRPTKLINGGRVIEIDKSECGVGLEKLTERLKESLYL